MSLSTSTSSCYDDPVKESVQIPWTPSTFREDMEKEKQTFYRMDGGETEVTSFPELRGKDVTVRGSFHSWIVAFKETQNQYLLLNILTRHSITLPPIHRDLELEDSISHCQRYIWLLTAPPGSNQNSFFLLFHRIRVGPILVCEVGSADNHEYCWRSHWLDDEILKKLDDSVPEGAVCSDGKIYVQVAGMKLVVIERVAPVLVAHILEIGGRCFPLEHSMGFQVFMMESYGDLYRICVNYEGMRTNEVVGVEVFRLDLWNKKWVKAKSLDGRAFCLTGRFCYPAWVIGREIRRNCVYFDNHATHNRLYSFNIETNALSQPKLPGRVAIKSREKKEEVKNNTLGSSAVHHLPPDLVLEISRHLLAPQDQLNFRAVNKFLRSVTPSGSLTDSLKEQRASLSDPWLICCRKNMDAYTLIDPLRGENYSMTLGGDAATTNHDLDAAMVYSKDSWCVMLQGTQSIFLWNPFTKEKIWLPECPHKWRTIAACGFSHSPGSPDFLLLLICVCYNSGRETEIYVDLLDHGEWSSEIAYEWEYQLSTPSFQRTLAILAGDFLCLHDDGGRLWVMPEPTKDYTELVLNKPILPILPHHKRSYLVDYEGYRIFAVLTSLREDDVQVFKLDISEMEWVEVDNLGDFVLYISHFSSFSRRVTAPGEGNRIYFPRLLYDGKLVYYSLHSKRYHRVGDDEPISTEEGGFQEGTEELMLYAWIQPKWF